MLDFATSIGSWVAVTFIPAFSGLSMIALSSKKIRPGLLSAFAFGIFMWYFVDTIGGAATLDASSGLSFPVQQIAILLLFALGALVFFFLDPDLFSSSTTATTAGLLVPVLVAVAVGFHGYGEGSAFGGTASSTSATSLLDAFGGLSAGVAYALHKGLEPMMIGAVYAVVRGGQATRVSSLLKDSFLLSVLFVIPSVVGAAVGYYVSDYGVYLFSLGTGTALYASFRLVKGIFQGQEWSPGDSRKIAFSMLLGFLCIYGAALLHS